MDWLIFLPRKAFPLDASKPYQNPEMQQAASSTDFQLLIDGQNFGSCDFKNNAVVYGYVSDDRQTSWATPLSKLRELSAGRHSIEIKSNDGQTIAHDFKIEITLYRFTTDLPQVTDEVLRSLSADQDKSLIGFSISGSSLFFTAAFLSAKEIALPFKDFKDIKISVGIEFSNENSPISIDTFNKSISLRATLVVNILINKQDVYDNLATAKSKVVLQMKPSINFGEHQFLQFLLFQIDFIDTKVDFEVKDFSKLSSHFQDEKAVREAMHKILVDVVKRKNEFSETAPNYCRQLLLPSFWTDLIDFQISNPQFLFRDVKAAPGTEYEYTEGYLFLVFSLKSKDIPCLCPDKNSDPLEPYKSESVQDSPLGRSSSEEWFSIPERSAVSFGLNLEGLKTVLRTLTDIAVGDKFSRGGDLFLVAEYVLRCALNEQSIKVDAHSLKVRLNATAEGRVTGGAKDRCGDIIFRREGALKIGISDIDLTVQFESHLTDYGANPNRSDPLGDTKIELQGKSRIGRINVSVSDIFAADMATYISGKILTKLAGSRLEKLIDGRVSRNLWVQDIYKNGTYFSLIDIVGYPSSLTFIGFANITLPRG